MQTKMELTLLQWNVRSFQSNKHFIQSAIDESKPTVICLQETRIRKERPINLTGYNNPARFDREDGRGGGVAIICTNKLPIYKKYQPKKMKLKFSYKFSLA